MGRQILGESKFIRDIREKLCLIKNCDATVLITGETGSGKEVLARTIHRESSRKDKPFVAVNCGGMPKELVENELFGHKKGAYSYAHESSKGLVEIAHSGILFLDEIDSLPLDIQPKFLRLLQEKEYRSVGDTQTHSADVRFIAATSEDLYERVQTNSFRSDLYYRLNILHLHLPPLRERKEDIPLFVTYFIDLYGKMYGKDNLEISREATEYLLDYNWPGNIRELEHTVHRAVIWSSNGMLQPDDFDLPSYKSRLDTDSLDLPYHTLKKRILEKFEAEYICKVLKANDGNISSASRVAGLDRRTFQRLMQKHNVARAVSINS